MGSDSLKKDLAVSDVYFSQPDVGEGGHWRHSRSRDLVKCASSSQLQFKGKTRCKVEMRQHQNPCGVFGVVAFVRVFGCFWFFFPDLEMTFVRKQMSLFIAQAVKSRYYLLCVLNIYSKRLKSALTQTIKSGSC